MVHSFKDFQLYTSLSGDNSHKTSVFNVIMKEHILLMHIFEKVVYTFRL